MYNRNLILLILASNSICVFKNTSVRRNSIVRRKSMSDIEKDDKGNTVEQHEMRVIPTSSKEQSLSTTSESINNSIEKREIDESEKPASAHVEQRLPESNLSSNGRRSSQSFLSATPILLFEGQSSKVLINQSQKEENYKSKRREETYRLIDEGGCCEAKDMFKVYCCKHSESSDAEASRYVSMFTSQSEELLSFKLHTGFIELLKCSEDICETSAAQVVRVKSLESQKQLEGSVNSSFLNEKNEQSIVDVQLPVLASFCWEGNVDKGDMSNARLFNNSVQNSENNSKINKLDELKLQAKDNHVSVLPAINNECFVTTQSDSEFHSNSNAMEKKEEAAIDETSTLEKDKKNEIIMQNIVNNNVEEKIEVKETKKLVQNKIKNNLFLFSLFLFATSIFFLIYKICKNSSFKCSFSFKSSFNFKKNIFISLLAFLSFISLIVLF